MSIEISGQNGFSPKEAIDAGSAQGTARPGDPAAKGSASSQQPSAGPDSFQISDQAAQLKALESEISSLPVVDTQRVQDVQRTLATGSFQMEPLQVADKVLNFEAGLAGAQ